jgi:hypothetical protein
MQWWFHSSDFIAFKGLCCHCDFTDSSRWQPVYSLTPAAAGRSSHWWLRLRITVIYLNLNIMYEKFEYYEKIMYEKFEYWNLNITYEKIWILYSEIVQYCRYCYGPNRRHRCTCCILDSLASCYHDGHGVWVCVCESRVISLPLLTRRLSEPVYAVTVRLTESSQGHELRLPVSWWLEYWLSAVMVRNSVPSQVQVALRLLPASERIVKQCRGRWAPSDDH